MSLQPNSLRAAALRIWESFLNVPYKWGGDDPLEGVDCSGLVNEGLKATGLIPREADFTADQLFGVVFRTHPRFRLTTELLPGMLVFFGEPRVVHVEIVWAVFADRVLTLGASGGGSATVDRAMAVRQNAYVKVRRLSQPWLAAVDPFPSAL